MEYFTAVWYKYLWPFGNVKYIFRRFGTLCQVKSGNPAPQSGKKKRFLSFLMKMKAAPIQLWRQNNLFSRVARFFLVKTYQSPVS
jgi:hypothetical protein